jgi:hypothetical protein
MHGINILPQARQLVDTNLSGWDGGTLFGDSTAGDPGLSSPVDGAALTTYLFQLFNQEFTWPGLTEAEERMLYTDKTRSDLLGRAFDSFREELSPYLNFRTERIWDYFFVQNHCMRMTINMVIIARSHIEVRCPFFDYDLFDFVFSLPNSYRNDRRLYRAVIQEIPSF